MACQLPSGDVNGISDPATCARHGGTWIPEPSLMTEDSSLLDNLNPLNLITPKAHAVSQQVGSPFQDDLFGANIGGGRAGGGSGTGTINIFKQPSKTFNPAARTPTAGVSPFSNIKATKPKMTEMGIKRTGDTQMFPTLKNLDQRVGKFIKQRPIASTLIGSSAVAPFVGPDEEETINEVPIAEQKVVNYPPTTSPLLSKEQREERDRQLMAAQNVGDTETVNQILAKGEALDTPPKTVVDKKPNLFDVSPDEVKTAGAEKDIPASIWERMQTKDYWLKGIEGGAGDWDNRLFRLGEMMAYMGTPLSKRGDSPAKRWTTAQTAANKLKADAAKATKKTNIFSKVGNTQMEQSIKHDVFKKMGGDQWLALDPSDEELQQQVSEAAIAIQTLIDSGYTYKDAKQAVLDAIQ